MQISVDKKMKHRNCYKMFRIPKTSSLFSRCSGVKLPDVSGFVDDDERLLDNLHRTNVELNSEAYEYYSKLASEEAGTDSHRKDISDSSDTSD